MSLFDKLKLRPFERRLVVVVAIVLFIVVQFLYIWPHFGDVKKLNVRHDEALRKLNAQQTAIAETNKLTTELNKLQGEGLDVPPGDQVVQFMRTLQTEASKARVNIQSTSKPFTRTNEFFLEQSQQVSTLSDESAMVDFLFNLGSSSSLIRVRDLTVRPDQSRTKLTASIKLVASYQKPGGRTTPAARTAPVTDKSPQSGTPAPAPAGTSTPTRKSS